MKIISWNVNGIRSVMDKGFLSFLRDEQPDIVCLQEIKHDTVPQIIDLFSDNPLSDYSVFVNPAAKKGYSGVAVLSKIPSHVVRKEIGHDRFDGEGRILECEFENFSLINIYVPHGARDKSNLKYKLEVYGRITDILEKRRDQNIILCGDFNVALEERDLANPRENVDNTMFTHEERKALKKLVEIGYIDSFRKYNEKGGNYTWWPYMKELRERNLGWRIDYIFVSGVMENILIDAFIFKDVFGSDHCPTGIQINP